VRRHANPRLYLGPKTNEIILGVGRIYGLGVSLDSACVMLHVKQRTRKCDEPVSEWTAYAVDQMNQVKIQIPGEFLQNAKRGFYDAKLVFQDCTIAEIEIVKAPSVGISCATTSDAESTCWQEPVCEEEPEPTCSCACYGQKSDCSCDSMLATCLVCSKNECVVKLNIDPEYSGINYAN
jgi:hypothetical protein